MVINFIMNSVSDPHLSKRILEFQQSGYEVRVYGFDRCNKIPSIDKVQIIGVFPNTLSYFKRIKIYLKGIRNLFKTSSCSEGIWYYQGLDVAMFATFFNPNKKYIYEECDLVHTNVRNGLLRRLLEWLDKRIIRRSFRTVMTSEGFLDYHYGGVASPPSNIAIIPNKLPQRMRDAKEIEYTPFNPSKVRFAFVGGLRYKSLTCLARNIATLFPNHEFHFYGFVSSVIPKEELPSCKNIFYHGAFKSPDDLPRIYADVDVVVSTYDISSPNVRYAEPNKLYEAIFFRRPIMVSRHTFLERKVLQMGIGYSVDPFDENDVVRVVKEIELDYENKKAVLSRIKKQDTIDSNNINLILRV